MQAKYVHQATFRGKKEIGNIIAYSQGTYAFTS